MQKITMTELSIKSGLRLLEHRKPQQLQTANRLFQNYKMENS